MALKDINLNNHGEIVVIDNDICTDSFSEDNTFWRLRNMIIKLFARGTEFWSPFKGTRVSDRKIFEDEIELEMQREISKYYPSETELLFLKIVALFVDNKLHVFVFRRQPYMDKDDKLFDVSISV